MSDKKKIVMIDDEEDLCFLVKANLEDSEQFEVATLSNPTDAEAFVKKEKPDVILLDVVMPERKGNEVVASLKNDPETKHIPVIMVSGKGEMVYNKGKDEFKWMPNNPAVKERGELPEGRSAEALADAYGATDYISKPFTSELLMEVITEVISRAKPSSGDTADE